MKYRTFLAFLFLAFSIAIFFVSVKNALAFTYTRTPNDVIINFGENINFSGHMEAPTADISSYQIVLTTAGILSECVDNITPLDEWDYNINIPDVPVGSYQVVRMYTYTNNICDLTGGEQDNIVLESGDPVFEIISIPDPVLGCTDPLAENYDPDATEEDGSCVYVLTTATFVGGIFLSLLLCMFIGIIIENLSRLVLNKLQ